MDQAITKTAPYFNLEVLREETSELARAYSGQDSSLRAALVERLRRLVARSEPQREVDLMICGAFIEARSCERFAVLGNAIGAPLRELFQDLHAAEERHYQIYLKLAGRAAARAALDLKLRIEEFAILEAELITSADPMFRFHSGPPGLG